MTVEGADDRLAGGPHWQGQCRLVALLLLVLRLGGTDGGGGGADGELARPAAPRAPPACPGQMGVDAHELHVRYSAKGAVDRTSRRAFLQPAADASEGSAIIGSVVPPSVCRAVSTLAAPLLEPAVQKRDSVDGEPEFQLDLLEPDSPHAEPVRPLMERHALAHTDACFVDVCLAVWLHLIALLYGCMAVGCALRDTWPALAAASGAPTSTTVRCHCARWSVSIGRLAEATDGGRCSH
eukprot:COSAG02_NODE_4112_length_5763_cov_3.743997_5_plen_238_part_00